ncbi:MAG: hypothetical protein ACE5GB_05555, partial [Acidimicrobiales bacterium]
MRLALRPTRRSTLVVVLCVSLVTAAVTVTGSAPAGAAHSPGSAEPFAAAPTNGLWLSPSEILALPTSGAAWNQLRSAADGSLGSANISNNESDHDVLTLAVALVYARTGDPSYRAKAAGAIDDAIGTESG